MRRIFAAIHIAPEKPLIDLLTEAKAIFHDGRIRWVNPEQVHLTLKFFGETPEPTIEQIRGLFRVSLLPDAPFSFTLQGLGIFGSHYQPRVVWAGTGEDPVLRTLSEKLLDNAATAGFPRDRLPFVPHLTLGRITYVRNKKKLKDWIASYRETPFQQVMVEEIILFESVLNTTGVTYHVVESFPLSYPNP